MSEVFQLGSGLITLAVYAGGVVVVLFIVYSGFLYATSGGESQRVAQARTSLFMCLLGLMIIGLAFIVPRVITESVVQPAGGVSLGMQDGIDCDAVLRSQILSQRSVDQASEVNVLIRLIQERYGQCDSHSWDVEAEAPHLVISAEKEFSETNYFYADSGNNEKSCVGSLPGGVSVPPGLLAVNHKSLEVDGTKVNQLNNGDPISVFVVGGDSALSLAMTRSTTGDIVVWFDRARSPWDGSICWIYHARYGLWVGQGYDPTI